MAEFTTKFRGIVKDESTGNDLYFFEVFLPGEKRLWFLLFLSDQRWKACKSQQRDSMF